MANIEALKTGSGSVFNIGTGTATKTADLFDIIYGSIDHLKPEFSTPERGPARPGDIRRSCLNIEKAKSSLDWSPTANLQDGVRETIKWYLTKHILTGSE